MRAGTATVCDERLPRGVCAVLLLGSSAVLWWGAVQLVRLFLA